jgi:hypothetical protein
MGTRRDDCEGYIWSSVLAKATESAKGDRVRTRWMR